MKVLSFCWLIFSEMLVTGLLIKLLELTLFFCEPVLLSNRVGNSDVYEMLTLLAPTMVLAMNGLFCAISDLFMGGL